MDGARDDLLAGARLAREEDGRLGRGDLRDLDEDALPALRRRRRSGRSPSRDSSSSVSDATRASSCPPRSRASAARRASPRGAGARGRSATWSATCWASGTSSSSYVPGVRERKTRPPANCHWPSKKIGTRRSERMPSADEVPALVATRAASSVSTSRTISWSQSFTRAGSSREIRIGVAELRERRVRRPRRRRRPVALLVRGGRGPCGRAG